MRISTDLWFEKASTKAEAVVQDPEDRKLLNPETYDLIHAIDYPHMEASGIFGDYVEIEAFQKLADRFLLACELIKTMESNYLETPDGSPRDCDTCIHWDDARGCRAGVWIQCATGKNTAITGDYWLPKPAAPEPRPAEETPLQRKIVEVYNREPDGRKGE